MKGVNLYPSYQRLIEFDNHSLDSLYLISIQNIHLKANQICLFFLINSFDATFLLFLYNHSVGFRTFSTPLEQLPTSPWQVFILRILAIPNAAIRATKDCGLDSIFTLDLE
ncbi:MAG TPA: hypothetical protein DCS30_11645 [Rhizobiales bacterium]|nr:hypothetical protein [Hyphomicrobiales bacterium]